ncbi:MAG: cysteine desulfurase [Rhodobacteraceae bacterium]|nr:cysteine desulfurase [Paracoccaceae bacterium]
MLDVAAVRESFPILDRKVNGHRLVYLDSGASAQKPLPVIAAVTHAYEHEYANVHRGLHYLSNVMTDKYEEVREKIRSFLNAAHCEEIIYTTGSTDSINLVAYSWAMPRLDAGDEIVLSVMEHHANVVPWHFLRERQGVALKWVEPDENGDLHPEKVLDAVTSRTALIAVTQTSNVTGAVVDVGEIARLARDRAVPVLVDASQSAVHGSIDVQSLGVDFLAMTGHKLYGPTASGALYVRRDRLPEFQPFRGGGDMIEEVTRDHVTYAKPPHKLEAGTPPIVQMIGLGAAIDYVRGLGMDNIAAHEASLAAYAADKLGGIDWLELYGRPARRAAIFSFNLKNGAHPHDVSTILDQQGIAVRAGHHCAQPFMEHLGVTATCRASLAVYNSTEDIDALVEGLRICKKLFG